MTADRSFRFKNLAVFFALGLLTMGVTTFLFFYLSGASKRDETFYVTLVWALFLEALSYGYILTFYVPLDWHAPTRFAVGTITGSYVAASVITMLVYNLSFGLLPMKVYYTAIIVESTLYILLTGRIVVLNFLRQAETRPTQRERNFLREWSAQIEQASVLISDNDAISTEAKQSLTYELTRIRESLQFNPLFGITRQPDSAAVEQIEQSLRELAQQASQRSGFDARAATQILQGLHQHLAVTQKALVR